LTMEDGHLESCYGHLVLACLLGAVALRATEEAEIRGSPCSGTHTFASRTGAMESAGRPHRAYPHDGRLTTLSQILDHHVASGQTFHAGPRTGVGSANPYKSSFMRGFPLAVGEGSDLIAFLESLTDETFVLDRRFASRFPASVRHRG